MQRCFFYGIEYRSFVQSSFEKSPNKRYEISEMLFEVLDQFLFCSHVADNILSIG